MQRGGRPMSQGDHLTMYIKKFWVGLRSLLYRTNYTSPALRCRYDAVQCRTAQMDVNLDEFFEDEGNLLGTLW
uniref:Uncharacterized protein n=1 Tax=Romanomermis culicivorax TaxID=13658 RepID=A0A915HFF8_ROMCU